MEISCVLTFVKGGAAAAVLRQLAEAEEKRIEGREGREREREREREEEEEEGIGRRGARTPAGV